ncbi:MAG: lipopolysaccharide heptosyltransferase family protein, partial [Undibacterium sp.]|nr:lipopolysaccharide heptosyltransferase family protein [Undibacterium sp.]
MTKQLIPQELLQKSNKILFITHLALGDYTYLQNFFQAFAQKFPHLKIHIWVDEVRRTPKEAAWVYLKKYALYDWLAECSFIAKIYQETYSPDLYQQSILEGQQETYPLVVSLCTLRPAMYASLARQIAPHGFVAGMKKKTNFFTLHHHLAYRKLDAQMNPDALAGSCQHISATYAHWFENFFGLLVEEAQRFPFLTIPEQWTNYAQKQLAQWQFDSPSLVFINPFAKNSKRCWSLSCVVDLISAMREDSTWRETCFIVNVVPEEMTKTRDFFQK